MIINDLDDYYIVFDTKNRNTELDTLYNKISLLHIYIYTQLLNYHGRLYRKYGDCYDEDAYYKWVEIANT